MTTTITRTTALRQYADPEGYRAERQACMGPTPALRSERAKLLGSISRNRQLAEFWRLYGQSQKAAGFTRKATKARRELAALDEQIARIKSEQKGASEPCPA